MKKSLLHNNAEFYEIEPNIYINFHIDRDRGYIELLYINGGDKVNSLFPISMYSIEECVNEFITYLKSKNYV